MKVLWTLLTIIHEQKGDCSIRLVKSMLRNCKSTTENENYIDFALNKRSLRNLGIVILFLCASGKLFDRNVVAPTHIVPG